MVNWSAGGDMVVASVTGSDLTKKYGWPEDFSQKSVPACYLAGALGKESLQGLFRCCPRHWFGR